MAATDEGLNLDRVRPALDPRPRCEGVVISLDPGVVECELGNDCLAVALHGVYREYLGAHRRVGMSGTMRVEATWSETLLLHQAIGMVSVQADCAIRDALTIVNEYADAISRDLADVVAGVLAGDVRFDSIGPPEPR